MMYEEYVKRNKTAFLTEVVRISNLLAISPEWLMIVMYAESGINETAVNKTSGATGLIQFMPKTAIGLGTTVAKLRMMTNVQQLYYVYKYFAPYAGKIASVTDLYKIVFFPAMIGKPSTWILSTSSLSAYTIANANKIIDLNRNGQITVAEFEAYVQKYLKKKSTLKS